MIKVMDREMKEIRPAGRSASDKPADVSSVGQPASRGLENRTFDYDAAFYALLDSSAEALVIIDADGIIQRASPRASDLLRLNAVESSRLHLVDFLSKPTGQLSALFAAEADPGRTGVNGVLPAGHRVRITLRTILPGTHHLLLCIEQGSVVYRAERQRLQAEAELRGVLDSVDSGIIIFDLSGRLRFANTRFAQLFGLDIRSITAAGSAHKLNQLLSRGFQAPESFSALWQSFAHGEGEPSHDELVLLRPTRRVIARFSRPALDAQGQGVGWIELYTDVTGERRIEQHLHTKMLQAEKMVALGHLVSGIAHELNNPLTAIMGYAQLLLGRGLSQSQLSDAGKVFQEAERARRIVKNLLYFGRENKPERIRVHLNEVVERTLALRSYELKVENISVECDLDPTLPAIMADPHQLQQVVLNLLVNAEQALIEGRGQGRIRLRTRHPRFDRVCLEISDDGPGVPPEIASRIFDPFFTTKPIGVGTGLGLSIVYGIVQQHDGDITFESRPAAGTKFVVELPTGATRAAVQPVSPASPEHCEISTTTGRILVVEDEPTIAQLIVDVLREEGHKVDAVLESQEGLTRLSRSHYDLVICDVRMPRLDGPAFYDVLLRTGSPLRRKIIFITGDTLAPRTQKFLDSHDSPYLAKPFLVEELKLAVYRLLVREPRPASSPDSENGRTDTRSCLINTLNPRRG